MWFRTPRRLAISVAFVGLHVAAESATAQARGDSIAVHGEVTDAGTGQPIANAVVRVVTAERSAFTDRAGRFRIEGLPPGAHMFEVSRLGYATFRFDAEMTEDTPISVELFPDPVLLEGLTVAADRFRERMRFLPYAVDVWTAADFREYHLTNTAMFLNDRSPWIDCGAYAHAGCGTIVQGRPHLMAVYIDDSAVPRSWLEVETHGLDRIHRIEFIRQCAMVRIYTDAYMGRVARGEVPMPRSFGGDCMMVRRSRGLRLP